MSFDDHQFTSTVFGTNKTYRIFFPADYTTSEKRYPVIYFFHGWGGRYNGDPNARYEASAIDAVVREGSCILVAWDGNMEDAQPRPYNIGYHNWITYPVQMKDYFLELLAHIDATYRTVPDREHRGLMGFSMGGFMSFYLAGKYPDKVCGAVNIVGSPEFFVGTPERHTLYPVRHAFGNLLGINLRFHRTREDELYFLNTEVHEGAVREAGLRYETEVYPGAHGIDKPGDSTRFTASFDFLVNTFAAPPTPPVRWHHVDLYSDFSVYDWRVTSSLSEPGYLELHGVTAGGLRTQTRRWLPDGPAIPGVVLNVRTAARYPANTEHTLFRYAVTHGTSSTERVMSDASGRIAFTVDSGETQVGLFRDGAPPELVVVGYSVEKTGRFLKQGEAGHVRLTILNRGGEKASGVRVTVTTTTPDVCVDDAPVFAGLIPVGNTAACAPVAVTPAYAAPTSGKPWHVRLNLRISDNQGHVWTDELDVPVWFDVPLFGDLAVDDGRTLNGTTLGTGNGDGSVNAGEKVMLYTGIQRLRLYTDDPYVDNEAETLHDEVLPSVWPDGYTLSSIVKIREDCPENHRITFLASCETKSHNPIERRVRWGTVSITVDTLK